MPRFAGVTSWEQNRQVFDAVAQSNGWDDTTSALQLLSHLEGNALNVALMVSETRRPTQNKLVGALSEHYGSPGCLVDYQHQFEKTARQEGEHPSIFAIALETLAVKAFGDTATLQDSASYVIDLLLAIVCDQRLPYGILLTAVGCGRATLTPRLGGLVNRVPKKLCRSILWTNRDVGWKTGW